MQTIKSQPKCGINGTNQLCYSFNEIQAFRFVEETDKDGFKWRGHSLAMPLNAPEVLKALSGGTVYNYKFKP